MFQKSKFLRRWYVLNSNAATLIHMDGPEDMSGNTIEFRRNGLVHVDTGLSRIMP